jgi:hypothetical protein
MVQQDSFLNPSHQKYSNFAKKVDDYIINWDEFQLGSSPLEVQ